MLTEIERFNVLILAVGCMAAAIIMREFKYVFSFGVGSAIMTLNFRFLRKAIEGIFLHLRDMGRETTAAAQPAGQPTNIDGQKESRQLIKSLRKKALIVKLPLKFFALVTAVILVVVYGDISVVAFLIGLSTVFLSVVSSYVSLAFKPMHERSKQHGA